jgi:MFS family permease
MVPWLELITKSFPATKRGSFFGLSQFIGGIGMVISGFIVSLILSEPGLTFPSNYGILVIFSLMMLSVGVTFIYFLKEKPDKIDDKGENLLKSLKEIPEIIKRDENFKRLAIIQLLISFFSMATPFYSIYSLSKLGADKSFVGLFLSFQMFGRLTSSFIWGRLCNKGLNKQIIQLTGFLFFISPIIAVFIGTRVLPREFVLLVFFLLGIAMSGVWLGFNNYVMYERDSKKRPLLLGFLNFLNIITSILPLIGGVIIEYLSYEIIFVGSVVPIGLALILSHNLHEKMSHARKTI